jgi:hypothetical protein
LGEHSRSQTLAFLVGKKSEVGLEAGGQIVQGAVRRSDEAVEVGELEEAGELTQTAGVVEVEDKEQGEDEAALEAFSRCRTEEGDELGVEPVGTVLSEPVAEGGSWDAVAACVLPLGEVVGVGEVVEGSSEVVALPA